MKATFLFPVWLFFIGISQGQVNIKGEWISLRPEKTASGYYGVREFTIKSKTWEVRYTLYVDSLLQNAIFTFKGRGHYKIERASLNLPKTYEALFEFDKKYITLKTYDTAIVKRLGFAACNLVLNVETDITGTGCSYFVSNSQCAQEYDLVSLQNNLLHLGARPASGSMCEEAKRPKVLGYPLIKKTKK